MKRQIWTWGYYFMTMGGNPNQPTITEVKVIEEKSVGKGFKAFSFKTPKGTIKIAESATGAIVGSSFKGVEKDIKEGNKKVMLQQIEDAKTALKGSCKRLTNKEFFQMYKY